MRLPLFMVLAALTLGGCATPSVEEDVSGTLLNQADAMLAAEDYAGAISSYSEFVTARAEHPQAARARATQAALEKLVAARAAIARAQQTGEAARRELTERQAETDRLKSDVAKLRTDLERLRNIDLQPQRQK
ncbi:MAG TPA: hypothetical protein VD867_03305 [Burkholderiales bacterium]|nr:hypothetical protein [Burkholderiales bacterium]